MSAVFTFARTPQVACAFLTAEGARVGTQGMLEVRHHYVDQLEIIYAGRTLEGWLDLAPGPDVPKLTVGRLWVRSTMPGQEYENAFEPVMVFQLQPSLRRIFFTNDKVQVFELTGSPCLPDVPLGPPDGADEPVVVENRCRKQGRQSWNLNR